MSLPDPGAVERRARATADTGAIQLLVAGDPGDRREVELTPDGYRGAGAGDLGRLAAALEVADAGDVRLHYPDPGMTAEGPWLVVEPLAGFVSTVHAGAATVEVALELAGATSYRRLESVEERVGGVLAAARPSHEHYPVADDGPGVFTRGMTTFSPESVTVDGDEATVSLAATVTPATTASAIRERFAGLEGVTRVTYEPAVGVERAAPSPAFRGAVERAHREVRGDAEYEWFDAPTAFSRLPTAEKIAAGTGMPDAGSFSAEEYDECVGLLAACVREVPA